MTPEENENIMTISQFAKIIQASQSGCRIQQKLINEDDDAYVDELEIYQNDGSRLRDISIYVYRIHPDDIRQITLYQYAYYDSMFECWEVASFLYRDDESFLKNVNYSKEDPITLFKRTGVSIEVEEYKYDT